MQVSRRRWLLVLGLGLLGCAPTQYEVRSRWLPAETKTSEPDVVMAQEKPARPVRLVVLPRSECAPCQDAAGRLEHALLRQGFSLLTQRALAEQCERHGQTSVEAARALSVDHVLAVEVRELALPVPLGRFERTYHAAQAGGGVGDALTPSAQLADRLDILANRAEQARLPVAMPVQQLSVALSRNDGVLLWQYEATLGHGLPSVLPLTLRVVCSAGSCREELPHPATLRPSRGGSTKLVVARPATPSSFAALADDIATRLGALGAASAEQRSHDGGGQHQPDHAE